MPLRIAHVVNEPFGPESANGVQQMVYCLTRAQSELGQSVAVFSREDGIHLLGSGAGATPRTWAPVHVGSLRHRLLSSYRDRALGEDVVAWQPDIVHFHSVHIPRNVALAAHLVCSRIPYCVTLHGALFPPALQRGRLKKALFSHLVERRYLNEARFLHAVSPDEIEAIRRFGLERPVVVVPNGVPPDASVRASRPDALYDGRPWLRDRHVFMFIGRLDPWQKGLDLLIAGFANAGLQNATLVLVGPDCGGSRHTLTALAARLGVGPTVVFTGPVFGEGRANLFAAAHVFVHPSRWEGLSLSVLAAAVAGKPCLITRQADPLGALERAQAALIVDASVSSIADGLRRGAAAGPEELAKMGTRGRRVVEEQFAWPSIASRVIEAYRHALALGSDACADGTAHDAPCSSSHY